MGDAAVTPKGHQFAPFRLDALNQCATKKKLRCAGSSKYADPSGSTGTVPATRSSVKVRRS
jgi:hypothetical protein